MKRIFLTFVFLIFASNCAVRQVETVRLENSLPMPTPTASETSLTLTSENKVEKTEDKPKYPGVSIDEKFPITAFHDFMEEEFKKKTYTVAVEDFHITINNFAPKNIRKDGKVIFNFKTLTPDDYWSSIVGISQLLGKNSKEIYVVATGPGGVCCTNYWVTDVSGITPRNIFRSEDYGGFRGPAEIFDADGDGVYELVQFDSAFRYFLDDCGACSPEPRATFKYDKKLGEYVPAKNIRQDFVRKYFLETEKWILESFEKLEKFERNEDTKNPEYLTLKLDYNRRFLDYVVDTFYLGEDTKAWKIFDKYYNGYNEKETVRAEIKNRLRQSKFYQALKKSS